jgi:hypothetical protein
MEFLTEFFASWAIAGDGVSVQSSVVMAVQRLNVFIFL